MQKVIIAFMEDLSEYGPEELFFRRRAPMADSRSKATVADFKKFAESFPDYPRALLFLGQSLREQGKLAEAHYYLGQYYRENGEPENAMLHFTRALRETRQPVLTEKIHKAQKSLKAEQAKKPGQDEKNRSEGLAKTSYSVKTEKLHGKRAPALGS
ncbi:tetratricopeptide (TPR) repeat protein [Desulfosalsimonas propionicica]|uniref:Tetratricopeptide (TPR) repeat protein n=1 Tax=Desulfosalsimonas propionicica TaxID=332175 RepID=A0A7W0CBG7_9BACT|nr:tetratricopeptide repeat protein [Desulfosalsimonas propionicica]MBA2882697.1 tetratricopeptide (TPR) repeat protein [Desulfosalsimonas propionicica]